MEGQRRGGPGLSNQTELGPSGVDPEVELNRRVWEVASEQHVREYQQLLQTARTRSSLTEVELSILGAAVRWASISARSPPLRQCAERCETWPLGPRRPPGCSGRRVTYSSMKLTRWCRCGPGIRTNAWADRQRHHRGRFGCAPRRRAPGALLATANRRGSGMAGAASQHLQLARTAPPE